MSTLYLSIDIDNYKMKTPETVIFYNESKREVHIIDQIPKAYSRKAPSRRRRVLQYVRFTIF